MMKRLIQIALVLVLALTATMPAAAQGYLQVYMNDGTSNRLQLSDFKRMRLSRVDLDGFEHPDFVTQEVVMWDSIYRFPLVEIDSIRFKKTVDAEVLDEINTMMTKIDPLMEDIDDVNAAIAHIDEIKKMKGVTDAYASGTTLIVEYENINKSGYLFPPLEPDDIDAPSKSQSRNSSNDFDASSVSLGKRALIVNQQFRDEGRQNISKKLRNLQRELGVTDEDYKEEGADPLFFYLTDFSQYDYVYIHTHGCYDEKNRMHYFLTAEQAFKNRYDPGKLNTEDVEYFTSLINLSIEETRNNVKQWVRYWAVDDNFIRHGVEPQSEAHTVLFNGCCQALTGNSKMADAFFYRGVSAFLGYDETNWASPYASYQLFTNIVNGQSLHAAWNGISSTYSTNSKPNEYVSHLRLIASDSEKKRFAFPVITESDCKYKDEGKAVEVTGRTTVANYENSTSSIKFGFRYGTESDSLNKIVYCNSTEMKYDANKHEITFSKKIAFDSEDDKLYFQAFTQDKSLNMNEGEVCEVENDKEYYIKERLLNGFGKLRLPGWSMDIDLRYWYGVTLFEDENEEPEVMVDLRELSNFNVVYPKGTIDLSDCTFITVLMCRKSSSLTSINVSGCTSLYYLGADDCQLTELNVSGCTALDCLSVCGNQLTQLDVSNLSKLTSLTCDGNLLTGLDVSGKKALEYLNCSNNKLTNLNISGCSNLKELHCNDNLLTDIEMLESFEKLYCQNNHINKEIPSIAPYFFKYDQKYYYTKDHYDYDRDVWIINVETNEYGWWYPGEPESCQHSRIE